MSSAKVSQRGPVGSQRQRQFLLFVVVVSPRSLLDKILKQILDTVLCHP